MSESRPVLDLLPTRPPRSGEGPVLTPTPRASTFWFFLLLGFTGVTLGLVIAGAFVFTGPLSWSVGLLYFAFDTWLLGYMLLQSARGVRAGRVGDSVRAWQPTVGVLVAARNERTVLPQTLQALLSQTDRPDQIFLIDDGSTDGTREWLEHDLAVRFDEVDGVRVGRSAKEPTVWAITKPNSGKARSLNIALTHATTDIVMTLDADTMLDPGAIAAVREAFARNRGLTVACGILRPVCGGSPVAPLFTFYQSYEYLRSFLWRLAWARGEMLVLVSGAFAAFRRDSVVAAGGFSVDSKVEDYELMFRLHRRAHEQGAPLKVEVLPEARAATDAPGSPRIFLKQRRRWFAGFLETMFRYRAMVGSGAYGRLGRVHLRLKTIDMLLPLYGLAAALTLIGFLIFGGTIHPLIWILLGAKYAYDILCHGASYLLYQRWLGQRATVGGLAKAVLATATEPFGFQLLRQTGALLGWIALLSGRIDWSPQRPAAPHTLR